MSGTHVSRTQQQISIVTLGVSDLERSVRFYVEGFGWTPAFRNEEIAFYQMNGLVLGTYLNASLEADIQEALVDILAGHAVAVIDDGHGTCNWVDRYTDDLGVGVVTVGDDLAQD